MNRSPDPVFGVTVMFYTRFIEMWKGGRDVWIVWEVSLDSLAPCTELIYKSDTMVWAAKGGDLENLPESITPHLQVWSLSFRDRDGAYWKRASDGLHAPGDWDLGLPAFSEGREPFTGRVEKDPIVETAASCASG